MTSSIQGASDADASIFRSRMIDAKALSAIALLLAGLTAVYWPVAQKLAYDWWHDDNYSHGFLIVPLALFFSWERRDKLRSLPLRPSWAGFVIVVGSLLMLLVGLLGAELFLSRMSLIATLVGMVVYLFGWP